MSWKDFLSACGEIAATVDIDDEANFLTSHAIGQLTLIRSKAAPGVVELSARMALRHVASLAADCAASWIFLAPTNWV